MALLKPPALIPGTASSSINQDFVWGAARSYYAYFQTTDDEIYVRTHLGTAQDGAVLSLFKAHPSDPQLLITEIRVAHVGTVGVIVNGVTITSYEWRAEITYSLWTPLLFSATGDPTAQPLRFRFDPSRIQKVADLDINNEPIVNAVGDPFDPPVEKDSTSTVLYVLRNEKNPNFPLIQDTENGWTDHVNAAAWNGYQPRVVKLGQIRVGDRQYSQVLSQLYYPVEYQFELNFKTWDKVILNQGFRQFDKTQPSYPADDTGRITYPLQNVLIEGQPAQEPVLLDKNGFYLQPPVNMADVVFLTYQIYKTLDFSQLNMDNLFSSTNAPPSS